MSEILRGYALPVRGDHGAVHWARVLENGLRVADAIGADREVVALFALFHDSRHAGYTRTGTPPAIRLCSPARTRIGLIWGGSVSLPARTDSAPTPPVNC
jgi:hypothetical protein